jgi:DNA-binding NarL/FixJ family response regulator
VRALRELLTGSEPRGAVLAGPSGVGKTRLGREALAIAERAGMATAEVNASRSAAQLPFGAFAPLLPADAAGPVDAGAAVGPVAGAGLGGLDDQVDLLRRSVAALASRADGGRLMLFVDDAHLLDDASATLLHQAVTTGAAVVVATVATGEPAPDSVVALWKDELLARVDVGGLDGDDVEALLADALGGSLDPAAAVQFTDRSRGNVLFLRELVMGALAGDNLHDESGIWRLRNDLAPSPRLVEIVEARIGRLDDAERTLLELVAYGEPLGQSELSALSDIAIAEDLERRDLLASYMDGRRLVVHLAHPLYGDVVRARTPTLRARTIAGALADAVEAAGPSRHEDELRVATWRLRAGGGHPDTLARGAAIARRRYDFALAEELAAAALDAGAGFSTALLFAQAVSLQGRRDEAEAALAALAAEAHDDSSRGQVAVARFDNASTWLGGDELRILDEAEDAILDPEWRDALEARRLVVLLQESGPRAAVEAALPLLGRASGGALAFACQIGGLGLARLGRLEAAIETAERGLAAATESAILPALYPWWHTVTRATALAYAGRLDDAEELVNTHHRQAVADGSVEAQAIFALVGASTVGERGRVRTAARRAREASALNLQLGRPLLARRDHIFGALALALSGDAEAAEAELARLEELALPHVMQDEVDLLQARAWAQVAGGDIAGGAGTLDGAATLALAIGDRVGAASSWHGVARLGRAPEVCEQLAKVAQKVDGTLATARAAHALALADSDAAALSQVSLAFEAMGADLLAAEASADAAVLLRQAGEARDASSAERRTGVLVDRCENPETPALQATEARARLTPAERETAVLAAAGRSNKDIAEELFLSPRTVENRLQRVYEKLGIAGRTEVADALALDDQ